MRCEELLSTALNSAQLLVDELDGLRAHGRKALTPSAMEEIASLIDEVDAHATRLAAATEAQILRATAVVEAAQPGRLFPPSWWDDASSGGGGVAALTDAVSAELRPLRGATLPRAMRGVEPIIWIGMAVEPCPPSAAHPAPQQPVRERLVSVRGGTH